MAGEIIGEKKKELKKELRAEIRRREAELSPDYLKEAGEKICRRIWELPGFDAAEQVFVFVGTGAEIDTSGLIGALFAAGKRVFVPRCAAKGIMHAYEIRDLSELVPGSYGIPEPPAAYEPVDPSEISFAIVPCLSCDREGYRLGHGGGYYDRYLEHVRAPRAVICREKLMLEHIPHEEHDLKMDFVVTEQAVYQA
ncbi:MAG: 5-formyltetrahydrofolate cyclo-ligase [Eubacteriales bacterium]|nr:5-formyltetrahydrofolate cyclo-ligase [Eubacteriales bacterium]